ncbi:MAG: protein phosphatase 2C domain-containing protein, partial [Lachnospiraceae bacterium]|nr:protein phosphatase 2C domain-containing protein [Lachnospiraceae bacterium]
MTVLKTFSITDIGKKRKLNQDYVYTSERPVGNLPNLFIVADGMGGHNAGDYASKFTVETIVKEIKAATEKNPEEILKRAIETANGKVLRMAGENPELEGMGTTVVAATCIGEELRVANVGDSRLYVIGEKITQVTRDHSLVEEMIRCGTPPFLMKRQKKARMWCWRTFPARGWALWARSGILSTG